MSIDKIGVSSRPALASMSSGNSSTNVSVLGRVLRNFSMLVVFLIIVFSFGYYVINTGVFGPYPASNKWQAVFLTNGQVYFGKLQGISKDYVKLTDIYYLQVSQKLQQAVEGQETLPAQSNINLIKLGDELHGPEDAMYIENSKVLFWENLKDNGRVVEAINQSKSKK